MVYADTAIHLHIFNIRINHRHFGIYIQSEIEQKKRKFNRTTIYRGRYRFSLIDELKFCYDVNDLSNKENLLKVGKLLCVESKTCDEIPNNVFNMADMKTEEIKLIQAKYIFKAFSDKIACLVCSEHPTFHQHNYAQKMNVYQSLKEDS